MNWISAFISLVPLLSFAAIGIFVDKLVRSREKAKFYDWLLALWMKFDDLRLIRFGKAEATAAIACYDEMVGARFFSVQRWLVTVFLVVGLQLFWTVKLSILSPEFAKSLLTTGDPTNWWETGAKWWGATRIVFLLLIVPTSLSLTRFISVVFVRFFGDLGLWAWFSLLLIHIALYVFWRPFVESIVNGFGFFLVFLGAALTRGAAELEVGGPKTKEAFAQIVTCPYWYCAWFHVTSIVEDKVGDIINGSRIAFAGFFLLSWAGGRILKDLVSRVWEAVLESKKPIIPLLFTGVGAVVSAFQWLTARLT